MAEQSIEDSIPSSQLVRGNLSGHGAALLPLIWRITIVFSAATCIWLFMHEIANTVFGTDYSRSSHTFRAVITSLLVIPLIVLARRFLDRRPWNGLGLSHFRIGWRPLLIGMICWLIPAVIGLVVCVALGWTEITLNEPIGNTLLLTFGLMLLVFIYEAFPEELIFRGYFYQNLATAMPRWLAVLGQAILFVLWGLANGGPNSIERSVLFFVAATILGVFRVVTGSVWASIGFHLAFQTTTQLFGTIGNQFTISDPDTLSMFAFGVLPFATGISFLRMFYKSRPDWFNRESEVAGYENDTA